MLLMVTQNVSVTVRRFRQLYQTLLSLGNVVTDQTQELILNGADIVKVEYGSGSVCTTRIQTDVDYLNLVQ